MQNPKRTSYCSAIRSEATYRHSYPGPYFSSDKEQQNPKVIVIESPKRRLSNTSLTSHDSGVGFSKSDYYEIQKAKKAQRVQCPPHIIVLHKGKLISHTTANNLKNYDEYEANIIVAAATASKRNRREIAVIQKRQTLMSIENNYHNEEENLRQFNYTKNISAPNLPTTRTQIIGQQKEKRWTKNLTLSKKPSFTSKSKLVKSVSISIKKFIGNCKEKKRRSELIQQIHEPPKFF